jgi:hypothetical protein
MVRNKEYVTVGDTIECSRFGKGKVADKKYILDLKQEAYLVFLTDGSQNDGIWLYNSEIISVDRSNNKKSLK